MKCFHYFLMLTLLAVAPAAAQDVDDFDFFLSRQAVGNGTNFGTINDVVPETTFTPGVRVIGAEFGELGTTDEPGFFNPGNVLPQGPNGAAPITGDNITLNRVDVEVGDLSGSDLFFWNGVGEVNFGAAPAGASISISSISAPLLGEGDTILTADETGAFDGHPIYSLSGGEPGLYLISITAQLGNDVNGLTDPTEPLFIVYGTDGIDEALIDAAVGFVSASLVPEPASLTMLLIGVVGVLRRRK